MSYLKALSIDHANMNVKNLEESVDYLLISEVVWMSRED
jgi:hypothetical protein